MAETAELDADLVAGLKAAKSKRMYFAFVMKGSDGALIVGKMKVPPAAISDAKKRSGGSAVVKGACFVEDGKHIFEMAKEPPATMEPAIKKIAKRDAGLTIQPVCRMGTAADLMDEDGQAEAKPAAAAAAANPATTAPTGFSPVQFAKWRLNWEAAKKKVLGDMGKLHSAIAGEFSDEADLGEQLATAVDQLLEELNSDLDDALNAILNGKDDAARAAARGRAIEAVSTFKTKLESSPVVKQVEINRFMPLSIQVPVKAALKVVETSLKG